jgi:hypothetical protein
MKQLALWLSAVAVLATTSGASRADYILSLSTNADAAHLHVGESVTFDVTLSGVDMGNSNTSLSYLAATISYDNTLLSPNQIVTPGAIIPDTTGFPDILGFVGTGFPDAADGLYEGYNFDQVNPIILPISQNGVFFSFQVTPANPGSGTLVFSAVATTLASDPDQNNQFTPNTVNLDFHIDASGTAVPEPSTFILLISSMLGLSTGAGLRGLVRRIRLDK